jgi:hypothetical protein
MLDAEEKRPNPNPSKGKNSRHQARPNSSKGRSFGRHQAPPRNPHGRGKVFLKDQQERLVEEGDRVGGRKGGAGGEERDGAR